MSRRRPDAFDALALAVIVIALTLAGVAVAARPDLSVPILPRAYPIVPLRPMTSIVAVAP